MTRSRDLADGADKDIAGTLTIDAAIVQGNIAVTGTVDGIDVATRDAILTSTTTTAGAALPKAGGTMTGNIAHASNFTVDVGGTVILDADNGNVKFADAGTIYGQLQNGNGSQFIMQGMIANQDMFFKVNDGGSTINAITIDASAAGAATFNSSVTTPQVEIGNGSAGGTSEILFSDNAAGRGKIKYNHGSNPEVMTMETTGTVALTIDNSQNVMVGKATIATATAGAVLRANGEVRGTVSGGAAARFSRLSSDGDIIGFEKDGSAVGTISVSGGNNLTISGTAGDHAGLIFATHAILPAEEGAASSPNVIDLGANGNEFKNLYLDTGIIASNALSIATGANLTLDAAGDITLDADGGDIRFKDGGTEVGAIVMDDGNNTLIVQATQNDADIKFTGKDNNSGITALTLDMSAAGAATFNAGVTAGGQVKVTSSSASAPAFSVGDAGTGFYNTGSNSIGLSINGANAIQVNNSGNVGIGITSLSSGYGASHALQIASVSDNNWGGTLVLSSANGTSVLSRLVASTSGFDIINEKNTPTRIFANNTERLRINANARICINGSATTNGHGNFVGEAGAGSKALMFEHTVGGGETGSITTGSSSTAYNTSSDYRLKENVVSLTGASARVNQLNPSRFNFIADDTNTLIDGFLAHEVATVVPEAIHGTHNEVDDENNAVMQGIDQSKLVPLLTAALQEALTEINDLKNRVTTLEAV